MYHYLVTLNSLQVNRGIRMGRYHLQHDDLEGIWSVRFVIHFTDQRIKIGPLYGREGGSLSIAIAIGKPDDIPVEPVKKTYSGEDWVEMQAETLRLALIRGEVLHVYRETTLQEFRQRLEAIRKTP